jgi:hypothetical protein
VRRQRARAPADSPGQTTPARALARLEQARAWGGPPRGVVADAADGDTPHCLAGVEARPARSVVAVRTDCPGRGGRVASRPVWRAAARLHPGPRGPWRPRRWRRGTTGRLRQQVRAVRGGRGTRARPRPEGWLVGERVTRGRPDAWQSSGRHLPVAATLDELAGDAPRRHAVEPVPEEAKGAWGWDQDHGRLGQGCHRHAVTVLLADRLLVWGARRQRPRPTRPERRRAPFSPAAGSSPQHTPGRAS